ncbi:fatty acid desaturase 4 chloroplastic [Phtheirospermum japonicum]|uniref:Fatty acid desaturase 4 chloroplastic n=1 Tax=Phtheirospermum japonicum TaxID=374723 RepID=A0A830DDF4_9LAMI|nr:fatty acid desaturase 4 chloroplastic [Phtheirospermum japonicum]
MAHQQNIRDENWYKATWAHRAWFATGCTTLLISLSKSILLISKMPFTPRTCLELPLAAVLGYLLSDLASAIVHWAFDNYGSAQNPSFRAPDPVVPGPPPAPGGDHQVRDRRDRPHPGGGGHRRPHAAQLILRRPGPPRVRRRVRRLRHVQRQVSTRGAHLPRKKVPPLVAAASGRRNTPRAVAARATPPATGCHTTAATAR